MAYNNSREKRKWELWKQQEEQLLRSLHVDEDVINELREYDYKQFNKDRSFRRKENITEDTFFINKPGYYAKEITNIDDLLFEIQSEALLLVLSGTSKTTLSIILLRMMGYSVGEIAKVFNMKPGSVYKRIARLREKIMQ